MGGYVARCPAGGGVGRGAVLRCVSPPAFGCHTQARSLDEVTERIREAIELSSMRGCTRAESRVHWHSAHHGLSWLPRWAGLALPSSARTRIVSEDSSQLPTRRRRPENAAIGRRAHRPAAMHVDESGPGVDSHHEACTTPNHDDSARRRCFCDVVPGVRHREPGRVCRRGTSKPRRGPCAVFRGCRSMESRTARCSYCLANVTSTVLISYGPVGTTTSRPDAATVTACPRFSIRSVSTAEAAWRGSRSLTSDCLPSNS